MNDLLDQLASQTAMGDIRPIDVRVELFRQRNFDFIVKGEKNGVAFEHAKQREALEVLTSNKYSEFLFGGGANGAKSWTGCTWLLFMGVCYPGTRYFVARNELKDIVESVYVTFKKVCSTYGFHDYKFNSVKNFVEFGNGTLINFVEIKRKPTDPLFEDLGSTEYTCGWFEEAGEIDKMGADVLSKRAGRHMNTKYGIKKMVFYTCNPKRNWLKTEFYDKWKRKELEKNKYYLPCLVVDNPFREDGSLEDLESYRLTNKVLYQRLYVGNWDYEDNPYQLCEYEAIEAIFRNNHIYSPDQKTYITADVARFGSDMARIGAWRGWTLIDKICMDISKTTEIEAAIMHFRVKYRVSTTRAIADGDGVGGGVVDGAGIKGFKNNGQPVRKGAKMPNYRNLQVQCLYYLAEKINAGEFYIHPDCDLTDKEKEEIMEELTQIQSKGDQDSTRKLDVKSKADIKQDIGRSPDWRDLFLMRAWFDLKPQKVALKTKWH